MAMLEILFLLLILLIVGLISYFLLYKDSLKRNQNNIRKITKYKLIIRIQNDKLQEQLLNNIKLETAHQIHQDRITLLNEFKIQITKDFQIIANQILESDREKNLILKQKKH